MTQFHIITLALLNKMIAERGPRYLIHGTIRRGEYAAHYADTGERAEGIREKLEGDRHYQVRVIPPSGAIDLGELGRARMEAKRVFDDATAILRAGVLRAAEENREETEIARTAGVDRMTVRSWLGKR